MPLQRAHGNMYDWVTHMWNCVLGECPHRCLYCYVKKNRFIQNNPMYKGDQRFNERDEGIRLGRQKIIFVAHTNDLFTAKPEVIFKVLDTCCKNPGNYYVFQTKDPLTAFKYAEHFPVNSSIGTTIETDDEEILLKAATAPTAGSRFKGIRLFSMAGVKTFITIEPIMKFTKYFAMRIATATPDWVNIGADSKKCGLTEPTREEIATFISDLQALGVNIKKKSNLSRIYEI